MKGIARLTSPVDEYSPYMLALFKLLDVLEGQQSKTAIECIEWLDSLDPSLLSTKCNSFNTGGQLVQQASDQEKYYAHLTKALFEADRYEACIVVCNEALRIITKPHNNNDIWWRRRKVLCEIELGDAEHGVVEMKQIALKKGDWFLWDELGDVLMKLNRKEEALDAYFRALPGWDEMKISFWLEFSILLLNEGQAPLAKALALASLSVRTDKGWKIPLELRALLSRLGLDRDSPEVPSISESRKSLQMETNRALSDRQPWLEGTIVNVLPNLKAAFIKGPHGDDNAFAPAALFRIGLTATMKSQTIHYQVSEGFDKKKNKPSHVVTKLRF
jgi:tetratricopeptide (TPR) repeat protein